jgi:hypothetical protein
VEIIGILFSLLFVSPIVVFGFVGFYWSRGRDGERLAGAWRAYARRRGHAFGEPVGDWPNRTRPNIRWTEGDVDYCIETRGRESIVGTRIVARPEVAILGELFVTRPDGRSAPDPAAEPMGPGLVVRAKPAGLAVSVLTDAVKRALLGFDPGSSLTYDRGEVSLGWAGGEENDARLEEASALVRRVVQALAATSAIAAPPYEAEATLEQV